MQQMTRLLFMLSLPLGSFNFGLRYNDVTKHYNAVTATKWLQQTGHHKMFNNDFMVTEIMVSAGCKTVLTCDVINYHSDGRIANV